MSTRGYCLFCLDSVPPSDNQDNTKTFVKFLERYAQTNFLDNLLNELNESKVPPILVLDCCQKCQAAVNDFCEIYHKIKCLEIQLGLKLDNLVNKIDQTDKISTKWHNLRDLLNNIFYNDSECNDLCKMFIRQFREGIKTGREKLMQSKQPDNGTKDACGSTDFNFVNMGTNVDKVIMIKCGECRKSFLSQTALDQHIYHVHTTRQLQCQHCRKRFHSQTNLDAHVEAHHNPEAWKHQCGVCKMKFRLPKQLYSHKLKFHDQNQSKPTEKDLIDEPFQTGGVSMERDESSDDENLSLDSSENNLAKEITNPGATIKTELVTQQVYENQDTTVESDANRINCDQCGRLCKSKKALQRHMLNQHTERKIPCPLCTSKYHTQAELRRHIKVHSNPENWKWQCQLCQKKFMVQRKLNKHLKNHARRQNKLSKTNSNADPLETPAPEATLAPLPSDVVIKTERE